MLYTTFHNNEGLPMGSPLSPVIANIYMEFFEELAVETSPYKPKTWLRYVDDTFIIWDQEEDALRKFLEHLNALRPSIKFTMEQETDNQLPFLDVMVSKNSGVVKTTVYRKPTHTGRYLNFNSNHGGNTKIGVAQSLVNRARTHCSTKDAYDDEINEIRRTLRSNGFPENIIRRVCNNPKQPTKKGNTEPEQQTTTLCIPYIRGISEKIKRLGKKYKIKTYFQTTSTIRSILTQTKPENIVNTKNAIYHIPCQCGRGYVGETKRPLHIRVQEHKKHTARGETTKSGVAEHVWDNNHHIAWDQAKTIHKEPHWYKRKFKEAAYIIANEGTFSKPSIQREVNRVWKPLLKNKTSLKIAQDPSLNTTSRSSDNGNQLPIDDQPSRPAKQNTTCSSSDNPNEPTTRDQSSRPTKQNHRYNTRYKTRNELGTLV